MSDEPVDDFVRAMLEANQKNKVEAERQIQEQRVREENKHKPYLLIKQQTERLVNLLGTVVQQFNQHSTPDQRIKTIEEDAVEGKTTFHVVRYEAAYKKGLALVFLTLYPALDLTFEGHGFVSLAAYSMKHDVYFLWSRVSDEDLLGEWIACRVKEVSPHQATMRVLPGLQHVEREQALRSLAASGADYEPNVRKAFSQAMVEAMTVPEE